MKIIIGILAIVGVVVGMPAHSLLLVVGAIVIKKSITWTINECKKPYQA